MIIEVFLLLYSHPIVYITNHNRQAVLRESCSLPDECPEIRNTIWPSSQADHTLASREECTAFPSGFWWFLAFRGLWPLQSSLHLFFHLVFSCRVHMYRLFFLFLNSVPVLLAIFPSLTQDKVAILFHNIIKYLSLHHILTFWVL